jgi:molybdopterin converting factor small subunit
MFAALREASGCSEMDMPPAYLPALLDELRERFGEPFTSSLSVSTVLVDGSAVPPDKLLSVPDGAEVALLPPVSGGSR